MANLAGKADPTLAKMAYSAAMANVPGDYSDFHQSTVDAHKELLTGIQETAIALKEKNEEATQKFNEAMAIFNDPLNAQMIDAEYEEMQAEVTAQREVWKANKGFKKDPEGLQNWNRKNQEIIGRHDQDGSTLNTIAEGVNGDLYDIPGAKIETKEYLTNVASYTANIDKQSGIYNKKTSTFVKNNPKATPEEIWANLGSDVKDGVLVKYKDPTTGEFTYISKVKDKNDAPMIINHKSSELLKVVDGMKKSDETVVKFNELLENQIKTATKGSDSYDGFSDNNKNKMEDIIDAALEKNPNALNYLYGKKFGGMKKTFEEALRDGSNVGLTNDIIISLGGINDKNGILERSDFAKGKEGAANYNKVVDGILDGSVKEVDGKKLLIDYINKEAFKVEHDQHKKSDEKGLTWAQKLAREKYNDYINKESGGKNKFGLNLKRNYYTIQTSKGASYIDGQTISNTVETFKSIQDKGSGIFTGYDDVPHKLIKGKWFTYDDKAKDFTIEDNAQNIFTTLGWNNYPQIMEYLKIKKLVDHDGLSPTPLQFLNTDWSTPK